MKRVLPWLVGLLAVLVVGWWGQRNAAGRAVAVEQARVAQAFADSVASDARKRDAEATKAREAIRVASEARKAAERAMRATQTAMHNLLDSVEASAADTSVGRDSLARLVTALAIKIRADSVARAEADSTQDAERLKAGFALAEQVAATKEWESAYRAEVAAHAKTKAIGRKSWVARVSPYVVVAATAYLAGSLDLP